MHFPQGLILQDLFDLQVCLKDMDVTQHSFQCRYFTDTMVQGLQREENNVLRSNRDSSKETALALCIEAIGYGKRIQFNESIRMTTIYRINRGLRALQYKSNTL